MVLPAPTLERNMLITKPPLRCTCVVLQLQLNLVQQTSTGKKPPSSNIKKIPKKSCIEARVYRTKAGGVEGGEVAVPVLDIGEPHVPH